MNDLWSSVSLQGLPQTVSTELPPARRAVWFVLLVGGLAASLLWSVFLITEFLDRASTTQISLQRPSEGLVFPAVTIWNLDPAKASAVPHNLYRDVCSPLFEVNKETVFSPSGFPNDFTDEIVFGLSHKMEDMLLDCTFKGRRCSAEDFEAVATPYPYSNWGIGYTFNPTSEKLTDVAGPKGGLHLVLSAEVDDYCPRTWGRGFRVQFHDHRDLETHIASIHLDPDLGSSVTPGHRWSFGLASTAYKLLGEPYSAACIDLAGGDEYPDPLVGWKCVEEHCSNVNFKNITKYNIRAFGDPCVQDCFKVRMHRFCDGVSYSANVGQETLGSFGSNLRESDFENSDTLKLLRRSKTLAKYIKTGKNSFLH